MILLQKSSSDGIISSSSPNSMLSGRAKANLFTKITSILATIFIVNSIALAYLASHSKRESSLLDNIGEANITAESTQNETSQQGSTTESNLLDTTTTTEQKDLTVPTE